jgi:Flp pilus assembly protein protease CpaA
MAYSYLTYRIGVVLLIALMYAVFDVFNRRNVPTVFAYATLAVGFIFAFSYLQPLIIGESLLIGFAILGIGYIFYRAGQIGAADVIELAAISLIIPIQPLPVYLGVLQYGLPFIISLFISAGIVALLMIPIYYIPRAKRILKKRMEQLVTRKDILKGALICFAYLAFMAFLYTEVNTSIWGIVVVAAIMIGSITTVTFERPITDSMVEYIGVSGFEDGDIIAFNLMRRKDISAYKKSIRGFDRLVTNRIISRMKAKHIKAKFPVYRHAMPLALPILIGAIISLLVGNVLLLLL